MTTNDHFSMFSASPDGTLAHPSQPRAQEGAVFDSFSRPYSLGSMLVHQQPATPTAVSETDGTLDKWGPCGVPLAQNSARA